MITAIDNRKITAQRWDNILPAPHFSNIPPFGGAWGGFKPHAVIGITDNFGNSIINTPEQHITYNPFQKTATVTEDGNFYSITYGTDGQRKKSVLQGDIAETRIYSGRYEKLITTGAKGIPTPSSSTIEFHYIPTPSGTVAAHIKTNGANGTTYYFLKDHLGSIMKIVNATGTLIEEHSYDAWGNHRKPTDWTLVDFASTLGISRGFTGHEMLPLFQLINMNGRMYDPVIGRVLSPDNFVANALNSQAYNRYSYCLNNPLKFIDPTGEKWKWWRWMSLCVGLSDPATAAATMSIAGSVIAGTAGVVAGVSFGTAGANTVFSYFTGLCDDNATFANRLGNYWKIAAGQFATDKDLTFEQRIWQFMSRHTIEQPFTTMGFAAQNTINAYSFYSKDEVKVGYFHGATVVQTDLMNGVGGFTLGSSITISTNSGALDYDNNALVHEYGHYLQIRHYGALPMLSMSASSLLSAMLSDKHSNDPSWHDWNWTEQDAVARSLAYFGDKMTDAQKDRFLNTYSNGFRAYYDGRFLRSYLFPASWEYLLYDYWFRN